MTRFRLDTHVWLWLLGEAERIDHVVLDPLGDRSNDLVLSAASSWRSRSSTAWESSTCRSPRRATSRNGYGSGVTPLPVEHAHALAVASLPAHHRDPFDRLLIAQASLLGIPVVTADGQFDAYDIPVVAV